MDFMTKGHMLPDATAILGAIDIVFGECDRSDYAIHMMSLRGAKRRGNPEPRMPSWIASLRSQ